MSQIFLQHERLARAARDALLSRGVLPDAAGYVTASLTETSLRGVDSHGIRLLPHYCRAVEGGRINRAPNFSIHRNGATACFDADHGFGHHAGATAMDLATSMAGEMGLAAVSVSKSSHFGAAAYFALRAARSGFVGMAFTNADALVKAYGAKDRFFGTNPICFCAPMKGEEPYCLDMATSQISWNKLRGYASVGEVVPEGLAYDVDGTMVTDAGLAHSLAPSGGYKGFGLGMMVDVLCALLSSGPISPDILPMFNTPLDAHRNISHFFLALDPGRFVDPEDFRRNLAEMAARVRGLRPLNGFAPQVAGDPEKHVNETRLSQGIPVNAEIFDELCRVSPLFFEAVMSGC